MDKYYANRGVERNKKPLSNKMYKIEVIPASAFKDGVAPTDWEQYNFKDEGYLTLSWKYETSELMGSGWSWHGPITPEFLKTLLNGLGKDQWGKFCTGKREFIEQRRVNGKNVNKKNK